MITKVIVIYTNGNKIEYELNREEPVSKHVGFLCEQFNAGTAEHFVLQVETTKHYLEEGDLNKLEMSIPPNSSLLLKLKPPVAAANALNSLQDTNASVKKKAIFDLRTQLRVSESILKQLKNCFRMKCSQKSSLMGTE